MTKIFKGASVYLSRSLVPPEIFDSLHDAVKHNGAQVFLYSSSSQNGPDDYHIISSKDHEKFSDLYQKGCNLLGPQCVLSCANEHRMLPKQRFTCCLAMDGVKVLVTGFEMNENDEIRKLVTAMGGVFRTKATSDVSFVIAKNVLAVKYKWALITAKKPIVTVNWLHQCWKEHRVVPQESYRVLPFSGLTICVTKIPADEREEMQAIIIQNGGIYSAELTEKCTHLVCDIPGGDKYKVAKTWGHIHVVTKRWFDQSVARKACLSEESYPVQATSTSSMNTIKTSYPTQISQKTTEHFLSASTSMATDADIQTGLHSEISEHDLQTSLSQNMSSAYFNIPVLLKDDETGVEKQKDDESNLDGCVADDSQNDENDLYLSDCRILFVGFEASEMRKLVSMVSRGGGSRYMEFNEKLTHIVVGSPSESEKKEVRGLAALGVIHVVKRTWLADCDRQKKETLVLSRHIATDLLLPKGGLKFLDSKFYNKGAVLGTKEVKSHNFQSIPPKEELRKTTNNGASMLSDKFNEPERDSTTSAKSQKMKSSVFLGRRFCFANSYPDDRKPEIIEWINEGGGEFVVDHTERNIDYTVELHGTIISPNNVSRSTFVSGHWIKSCLESGNLLDLRSHIIYTPLQCKIKLPGFDKFRLCVSQYEEKDRVLLGNLCFTLGARVAEKLNTKITHLLCKFTSGAKYEAACKWGVQPVTSDWLLECVKQNKVVDVGPFYPKEATAEDREAGHCTTSQYPTQAVRMSSGEDASQLPTQSNIIQNNVNNGRSIDIREDNEYSNSCSKRPRLLEDERVINDPVPNLSTFENKIVSDAGEVFYTVPDVAAAIEDLLEQTSKIHEKSPGRNGCDISIYSSCPALVQDHTDPQPGFGLSKQWINRTSKKDDKVSNATQEVNAGMYDGFSETQTESQVVGYEEDLSGRQMIIDRVRTRSSMR